ncbi:ureidoglycolate lyase [Faunimonas pinastri]|uniref:Ureidoglycolate lyase n=1 Tax=Faunimonas pinastri TaxID=1855383 RepID=A0A1H9ILD8_9HYPH|nr:ureidoglycolate lyase [Faunimonas pinastri]SEQ75329.1 ureidoglycolate lyase [Faunimonas pinastri]
MPWTLLPSALGDDEELAPFATPIRGQEGERAFFPVASEKDDAPGRSVLSVFRHPEASVDAAGFIRIGKMERHPHSSQSFLPLKVGRWLVIAAPALADGSPDVERAVARLAGPGEGICYHRDMWHAPMTVLDGPADMAMLMWSTGTAADTVKVDLPEELIIDLTGPGLGSSQARR